jgi:hypothetical protein
MQTDMTSVSNKDFCGSEASSNNIGFYFRTVFPVGSNDMLYSFHLPVDFGHGGVAFLDGGVQTYMFEDTYNTPDYNFDVYLNEGMHVLEIYGAEGCCDGVTSWAFAVHGGDWIEFTAENLNMFKFPIPEQPDICADMTGYDKACPDASGWHYTIDTDTYQEQDVCTVMVSTSGGDCKDYCAT